MTRTALINKIKAILGGNPPDMQAVVLAELVTIWLVGFAPQAREEILELHIRCVRELMGLYEEALFGEAGHPARRH